MKFYLIICGLIALCCLVESTDYLAGYPDITAKKEKRPVLDYGHEIYNLNTLKPKKENKNAN